MEFVFVGVVKDEKGKNIRFRYFADKTAEIVSRFFIEMCLPFYMTFLHSLWSYLINFNC